MQQEQLFHADTVQDILSPSHFFCKSFFSDNYTKVVQ